MLKGGGAGLSDPGMNILSSMTQAATPTHAPTLRALRVLAVVPSPRAQSQMTRRLSKLPAVDPRNPRCFVDIGLGHEHCELVTRFIFVRRLRLSNDTHL